MIFVYGDLHIIWKRGNVKIGEHSIFSIIEQNVFHGTLNIPFFIDISWRCLINNDNLLIFKFRNFMFDLKDNFVNN